MRGGWSLDVACKDPVIGKSWDLADPDVLEEAAVLLKRDKPSLLILSPPCTKFSNLLRLGGREVPRALWIHAVRMVNAAVRLAEIQLEAGRHFVFEHPLTS